MPVTSNFTSPVAKMFIVGLWVEALLYGVNFAMFGLCMFVLLRGGKAATLRWMLIATCAILFVLCTAHAGLSLQQLLDAFVYGPADVSDYSATYFVDLTAIPRVLKDCLYVLLVLVQHIILIWRLYVVFMYDWRVVVLPMMLSAGCIGSAFATPASTVRHNNELSAALVTASWAFGLAVNVVVTLAIAGRLWWMHRVMASLTASSTNRFASSIYVAIESGAITGTISVVLYATSIALYATPVTLVGFDIAAQLMALAPFLIVVQLGVMNWYRVPVREL